jgi:hypothetical protein
MKELRTSMQKIQIHNGSGYRGGSDKRNSDEEEIDYEERSNICGVATAVEGIWIDFYSTDLVGLQGKDDSFDKK